MKDSLNIEIGDKVLWEDLWYKVIDKYKDDKTAGVSINLGYVERFLEYKEIDGWQKNKI